jgi:hypothetical protein
MSIVAKINPSHLVLETIFSNIHPPTSTLGMELKTLFSSLIGIGKPHILHGSAILVYATCHLKHPNAIRDDEPIINLAKL